MSRISRGNAALAALGVAAFVFGTAEFVIVGVLDLVARDLRVSVSTAGQLAATLSASAINAGIAAGSLIGGWVLARYGVDSVVLLAAALCAMVLPGTVAARFIRSQRVGSSQNGTTTADG